MSWKTITSFVTDPGADMAALDAAIALAGRAGAQLEVFALGVDVTQPEVYYTGTPALGLYGALEVAQEEARELEAAARVRLEKSQVTWAIASAATPSVGMQSTVADAARFSDLVVAPLPYGKDYSGAGVQVVEAALFGAQVPVLIVPGTLPAAFSRAAIAWNDSPEALAAIRAALPVLCEAKEVEIVLIDPPSYGPDRSDPGGRLQQMLTRHGVAASIRILSRGSDSVGMVLSRHLGEIRADLLVMGAYGKSRLREAILGGATREMLEGAGVPVLMAH